MKINQLINQDKNLIPLFIQQENSSFANATIDINGNICRLIIDSVSILKQDEVFAKKYLEQILIFINETFQELDKFIFRDKKYVINKQLFKLYWCLEALKLFAKNISTEQIYPILSRASKEKEYTIREKVAQIVIDLNDSAFADIKKELAQDENYYVRAVFKSY